MWHTIRSAIDSWTAVARLLVALFGIAMINCAAAAFIWWLTSR